MATSDAFSPDWASPPGETIADVLADRDLSVAEFARRMEQPRHQIDDLLAGRATITLALARQLAAVLGASREFWMSRDYHYREDAARLDAQGRAWLDDLPLSDMLKFGWIEPALPQAEVRTLLDFFGVPSIAAWRGAYAGLQQQFAFRTSDTFDSYPGAVAAWLRRGELEAAAIPCGPWDPERFRGSLAGIRALTKLKDPAHFLPKLQELCAASGVAVVVVRAPTGCRASGATRFLSPTKALLMLSFRYRTDDQLWFTFFHEAGHLLLHGDRGLILESADEEPSVGESLLTSREEQEANEFAAKVLIPDEFQPELLTLGANHHAVMRFASRVGIASGIVVGQLQHLGRVPRNQLNRLKRRFSWDGP